MPGNSPSWPECGREGQNEPNGHHAKESSCLIRSTKTPREAALVRMSASITAPEMCSTDTTMLYHRIYTGWRPLGRRSRGRRAPQRAASARERESNSRRACKRNTKRRKYRQHLKGLTRSCKRERECTKVATPHPAKGSVEG